MVMADKDVYLGNWRLNSCTEKYRVECTSMTVREWVVGTAPAQ